VRYRSRCIDPEAISSAAPAIADADRRGSDGPLLLPITMITAQPVYRFNDY